MDMENYDSIQDLPLLEHTPDSPMSAQENIPLLTPNGKVEDPLKIDPGQNEDTDAENAEANALLEQETLTFHQAARNGKFDVVKQYLDEYIDINDKQNKEKENLVEKLSPLKQNADKPKDSEKKSSKNKNVNRLDDHQWSALHYAVRYGHLDIIKLLCDNEADVNVVAGDDGGYPLHVAAKYFKAEKHMSDKVEVVEDLVAKIEETSVQSAPGSSELGEDAEAIVSAEDKPGIDAGTTNQPVQEEEEEEILEVITYLLKHGADINCTDNCERTPLHYAATKGNVEAVTLLLNWPGIDLELVDTAGQTALQSTCCGHAQPDTFKLLLQAGSKLMVKDRDQQSPLHTAAEAEGGELILQEILRLATEKGGSMEELSLADMLNDQDDRKRNVLHRAVEAQNLDICRLAVQHGVDVNAKRGDLNTPVHVASLTGNIDIVKLLVSSGANKEPLNVEKQTPLHLASKNHNVAIIEYLLKIGCNVNAVDRKNRTPVVTAASQKGGQAADAVQALLNRYADLTEIDNDDKSALFWAAEENSYFVLQLLLEKIRSRRHLRYLVDQRDRLDNTPLHIACTKGFQDIVRLLIMHHARLDHCNDEELTPLHLASINGNETAVIALLRKQKNLINQEEESGNTALHLAASNGHAKLIDILVDSGASVDAQNITMSTALHTAARKGHLECCIRLIEREADMNCTDLTKSTPLHVASKEGNEEVVKELLNRGADISITDHRGQNALNIAIDACHKTVVEVILQHKDWLVAAKNHFIEGKDCSTAIHQLIRKLPDLAYCLLNKCTKLSVGIPNDAEDFQVNFLYELIDDISPTKSSTRKLQEEKKEVKYLPEKAEEADRVVLEATEEATEREKQRGRNHPLIVMCENNQESLLMHPLCLSLIYHKWQKFGRYVFYSKFLLYFVFLLFFSGFLLVSVPLIPREVSVNGTDTCVPVTAKSAHDDVFCITVFPICRYFVIILSVCLLCLEGTQILSQGIAYFELTNISEWVIYVGAILYAWPDIDMVLEGDVGIRGCVAHVNIGAIGIFLAWINLLLFLQKFPTIGIYVVMLIDVTKTFLKFSITLLLFLFSFAIGFYTLEYTNTTTTYKNIGRTLAKTMAMMMGDFDFDAMFNEDVQQPLMMWFLFFLFLVAMVILLTNLMVGLAVGDIQAVLDKAVMARISMQVNLIMEVEKSLPKRLRAKFLTMEKTVFPNREFKWYKKILMSHITSVAEIEDAMETEAKNDAEIENQLMRESVDEVKHQSRDLQQQLVKIEGMVQKLLKASNVKS